MKTKEQKRQEAESRKEVPLERLAKVQIGKNEKSRLEKRLDKLRLSKTQEVKQESKKSKVSK